jgi:hypothetical protein
MKRTINEKLPPPRRLDYGKIKEATIENTELKTEKRNAEGD